jgi:hypothetical protein
MHYIKYHHRMSSISYTSTIVSKNFIVFNILFHCFCFYLVVYFYFFICLNLNGIEIEHYIWTWFRAGYCSSLKLISSGLMYWFSFVYFSKIPKLFDNSSELRLNIIKSQFNILYQLQIVRAVVLPSSQFWKHNLITLYENITT